EAEEVRLDQGRRQVSGGLGQLLRIKIQDMVGAEFKMLLADKEAPGQIAQGQPYQGEAQAEKAAPGPGGTQPGQGQDRGQDHRGGQGRAFVFAPGHTGQKKGGQGEAPPGRLTRQPQVNQADGPQGEIGQGQVGVSDVKMNHEHRAVQGQEGGEPQGQAPAQTQAPGQGIEQSQQQRPPEREKPLGQMVVDPAQTVKDSSTVKGPGWDSNCGRRYK